MHGLMTRPRGRLVPFASNQHQAEGEAQLRRGKMMVERKDLLRVTQDKYKKELEKVCDRESVGRHLTPLRQGSYSLP